MRVQSNGWNPVPMLVGFIIGLVFTIFGARDCGAQPVRFDNLTPYLPTQTERTVADVASWATVITAIALDAKATWDQHCQTTWDECEPRLVLAAIRVGATYGAVFVTKALVFRERPCSWKSFNCGIDNPNQSFFSGHTAFAFSTIGWSRLTIALPLAVSTGGLRVAAGKHWLTDTLMGAGVGLLTSRIR